MTHTPGPWNCNVHDWANVYASNGTLVAIAKHDGHVTENQTLIAAAPELLEALKRVSSGITPDLDTHDCEFLRNIARAAIAKAEGKECRAAFK